MDPLVAAARVWLDENRHRQDELRGESAWRYVEAEFVADVDHPRHAAMIEEPPNWLVDMAIFD